MAHPESPLRRINHCGCYKVSDDSRLWFMSSFKHSVINYNKVEEFGGSIDYTSQVVLKVVEKDEQVEVKEGESEVVSNLMEEINKKNTP